MPFLVLFISNVSVLSSIVMSVSGLDLLPVRKSMNGVLISVGVTCLSFSFPSYDKYAYECVFLA